MLILPLRKNGTIHIGDDIVIRVTGFGEADTVNIGIDAPRSVPIYKGDIYKRILEERKQAAPVVNNPDWFSRAMNDESFKLKEAIQILETENMDHSDDAILVYASAAAAFAVTAKDVVLAVVSLINGDRDRIKEFGVLPKKDGDHLLIKFHGESTTINDTAKDIQKYIISSWKIAYDGAAEDMFSGFKYAMDDFIRGVKKVL